MTDERCENCRYFDRAFIDDEHDKESWCRRYPPVYIGPDLYAMLAQGDSSNDLGYWDQPTVGIKAWCGEWRNRDRGRYDGREAT